MKKLYLSALPLLLLAAPFAARLNELASRRAGAAETEAVASVELAEREYGRRVRARISDARKMLEAHRAADAAAAVTLAVEDAAAGRVHLLTLPKETFLKAGTEIELASSLGVPLRLLVVRPNYVNTAVRVLDRAGRELSPLLVRYPVEKGGKIKETAFYTSAHPAVSTPEVTREGRRYVRRMLDEAAARLAARGHRIDPSLVSVAERLCFVEHVDHKRFKSESHPALFDEIGALYSLNAGDTYRYSVSTAGAGGMIQMIPSTYELIRQKYSRVGLRADFVEGMRDHANALEAMLLYIQDTWDYLLRQDEVKQALATGLATQSELLAAGYNSNPARLARYLERGGTAWRTLIPEETKMYLLIYASVERHVPFADARG
jgi:hypothetical protein